ncbi:ATP-binding protein [Gramella sp. KN1008]|uniref:ATP-binding protein n=1 Tax=Gramella sp. KN1008 TaxID=2529298 RepID=UPI00103C3634|nr:transporter substrate-binding domain-containing protein [Gramella sp. KN1008]TBW30033.1 transporter substrate-binding domain-containing protein [Gramella sp. KN1008]
MLVKSRFLLLKFSLFYLIGLLNVYSQDQSAKIKVGVYENPPKIFSNEKGEPEGIFIDLIDHIANKENIEVEYVHNTWAQLLDSLEQGKIDLLPDVAYSARRDSLIRFNSVPVIESWLELYSIPAGDIRSVRDLNDKRIGVLKGSVQEYYLKNELRKDFSIDYSVVTYADYPSSIEALIKEEIDAVLADRFFHFSNSNDEEIVSTGVVLRPTNLYLAFSENMDTNVVNVFDKNLSALRNDSGSEYYMILQTWLNRDLGNPLAGYLKWIIIGFLVVFIIIFVFNIMLRRQVKLKTKQLYRRNRELTLAKEKAEESERLKTAFLQNMSHEIRTPMNGILGFMKLIDKDDLDRETRKEYVSIVRKSGRRLLTTINNLVEFSKIRSQLVRTSLGIVNVEEIMEYHQQFFQTLAIEKDIKIGIEKQVKGQEAIIETDRNMLDGILTNLINNAVKFTFKGGVFFGNYIENENLVFYVKDSGTGIPEERLESIFNPFVQGNQEISRPYEGSGLGLAIVKEYVDLLGGKLWVDTEIGKGSTFFFSIPYNLVSSEKKKEKTLPKIKFEHKRILVAEDDNISYILLAKILNKLGLEAVRARNGEEAIEIAKNDDRISLILMDVKMPVKSGIEAVREIRSFNKDIPIVAQTAFAHNGLKETVFSEGFNEYINKPIDECKLAEILKKFLPVGLNQNSV